MSNNNTSLGNSFDLSPLPLPGSSNSPSTSSRSPQTPSTPPPSPAPATQSPTPAPVPNPINNNNNNSNENNSSNNNSGSNNSSNNNNNNSNGNNSNNGSSTSPSSNNSPNVAPLSPSASSTTALRTITRGSGPSATVVVVTQTIENPNPASTENSTPDTSPTRPSSNTTGGGDNKTITIILPCVIAGFVGLVALFLLIRWLRNKSATARAVEDIKWPDIVNSDGDQAALYPEPTRPAMGHGLGHLDDEDEAMSNDAHQILNMAGTGAGGHRLAARAGLGPDSSSVSPSTTMVTGPMSSNHTNYPPTHSHTVSSGNHSHDLHSSPSQFDPYRTSGYYSAPYPDPNSQPFFHYPSSNAPSYPNQSHHLQVNQRDSVVTPLPLVTNLGRQVLHGRTPSGGRLTISGTSPMSGPTAYGDEKDFEYPPRSSEGDYLARSPEKTHKQIDDDQSEVFENYQWRHSQVLAIANQTEKDLAEKEEEGGNEPRKGPSVEDDYYWNHQGRSPKRLVATNPDPPKSASSPLPAPWAD